MKKKFFILPFVFFILLILNIIDQKTAFNSAKEGIALCMQSVIPSLFPLMFLSTCISNFNLFSKAPSLRWIGIPQGAAYIFFLGLLSGYPVGSQLIYDSYKNGNLSKETSRRMLGFCNNPGPSFLFGILAPLFTSPAALWCLWGIIILSAILTGVLLPKMKIEECAHPSHDAHSIPEILAKCIRSMTMICGWVILFRILFSYLEKHLLSNLPSVLRVTLIGITELTNGCVALQRIPSEATRFILCSVFLSFGGLCVSMQTRSVTKELGLGMYFPGKILQSIICVLLSIVVSFFLF